MRLGRIKLVAKSIRHRIRAFTVDQREMAQSLKPVFVLGANRSGTSVCTRMLSLHPEIEGLFDGGPQDPLMAIDGHSMGYGEAGHIWRSLAPSGYDSREGESALWGLPGYVSKFYTSSVSDRRRRQLINEVMDARNTNLVPLIKLNHNVFRIPLIKDLFPKARFVFISRDHKSYIESNKHKWAQDKVTGLSAASSFVNYPHIGLHWLLINTITLYDLRKYAEGDYFQISLQELQGETEARNETINRMFIFLGLEPIDVDESVFDSSFVYRQSEDESDIQHVCTLIDELINFENSLP